MAALVTASDLGLLRAVKKFQPGRGTRFSTYEVWWIRQAVARALANQARTIRLPVRIELLLGRHAKAKAALTQELGVTRERVRQIEAAAFERLGRLMAGRRMEAQDLF